jgi:hypothetical protein
LYLGQTRLMTLRYSSRAAKELVLQYVLDSIDEKKRALYLQEIISMGKSNNVWIHFLTQFLERPVKKFIPRTFSKN